jgi:hypothetical protein
LIDKFVTKSKVDVSDKELQERIRRSNPFTNPNWLVFIFSTIATVNSATATPILDTPTTTTTFSFLDVSAQPAHIPNDPLSSLRATYGTLCGDNKAPLKLTSKAQTRLTNEWHRASTALVASVLSNLTTYAGNTPTMINAALVAACPAMLENQKVTLLLEPLFNELPNGMQLITHTPALVNGWHALALIDSGCSMPIISQWLLESPGPAPRPPNAVTSASQTVTTHALGTPNSPSVIVDFVINHSSL